VIHFRTPLDQPIFNLPQVFVPREELSLDVIKQYRVHVPPSRNREQIESDKIKVLEERIFPAAEKLGQSIIFVKTRETARLLFERSVTSVGSLFLPTFPLSFH
jgi:superfamily II DNA/RNA helicase